MTRDEANAPEAQDPTTPLTDDDIRRLIAWYRSDQYAVQSGGGWKPLAAMLELQRHRADAGQTAELLRPPGRLDVLILDGRPVEGTVRHGKRYEQWRNFHVGEMVCLDDHWLDLNGFALTLDRHTKHARFAAGKEANDRFHLEAQSSPGPLTSDEQEAVKIAHVALRRAVDQMRSIGGAASILSDCERAGGILLSMLARSRR